MKIRDNIKNSLPIFCLLIFLFANAGSAVSKEVKEHPLIRPFPGSVLAENMSKYQNFNEYEFYFTNEQTHKKEKKKIQGEYYHLLYEVRTASGERVGDISTVEFFENYKAAAAEKEGTVVYEDRNQIVMTLPRDDGGTTWCKVTLASNLGQQYLNIIDEKGFEKSMAFGPKELKAALDKDGKILLYGILFDLDKATLKPESVKQLQHIVSLMTTYADLNLEVQGHTDSQGSDDYNMTLSQNRAQTVCTYLELFGIQQDRLLPKGYGETKPVATNDTEDGRAKNRRVELVKIAARAEGIEGKWEMAPNKRVKTGAVTFYSNGTYLMEELLQDGDKVSRKGEYKINAQSSPQRMDLCLEKCDAPGSEYTTSFSIFRFSGSGILEIRSSPDENYPTQFNNGETDEYTLFLTRVK